MARGSADGGEHSDLIALSASPRQLGEFIANLLGQRRRISRSFDVNFFVDWPWIQNLDHLVIQRVEHQNEGQLVDFSFKLFLSNGRITHITSRQDFKAFRDISSFECIGVELAWTFIVKFPTSKTPEKQEIRFVARSALLDEQDRKSDRNPYAFFVPLRITDEEMLVEIFYSNITWGEDLLQVISNHVSSSFGRSSRVAQKIASLVVRLASPFVMLLFIVSTYIQFSTEMSRSNTTIYQLLKPLETRFVDLTLLNNKLDVIIRARIDAYSTAILRPLLITILGVTIVVGCIAMIEYIIPRSFILLNDFTVKKRVKYASRRQLFLVSISLAFIVGVLSSIFASKIIEFLFG